MNLLNYEKIIKDSYPYLIESYVAQYGEEYREHIIDTMKKIDYCIFVTPDTIKEYVCQKIVDDHLKAIIDTYESFGIDTSSIKLDYEFLTIGDPDLAEVDNVLFSSLQPRYLEHLAIDIVSDKKNVKFLPRGIFAFADEYDGLGIDDEITLERMAVLKKLNIIREDQDINFDLDSDYTQACQKMKKFLYRYNYFLERHKEGINYLELYDYAEELDEKIFNIIYAYEKKFLRLIKKDLSSTERAQLRKEDIDIYELQSYGIYFDDSQEFEYRSDYQIFSDGLIDYFNYDYTEKLLSKKVSLEEKQIIIENRMKYLKSKGFEIRDYDVNELCCDWYELKYMKDLLPPLKYLDKINAIKESLSYELFGAICSLLVINDFDYETYLDSLEMIIESTSICGCCQLCEVNSDNSFRSIIYFNPLHQTYNGNDFTIDHEIRHAIETRIIGRVNDSFKYVVGVDRSFFVFDENANEDDKRYMVSDDETFTIYNERMTERLSVDATKKRWEQGQYILSDRYANRINYYTSEYQMDFSNLNIFYKSLSRDLIDAQISPDVNKIFRIIPQPILKDINNHLQDHSKENREYLQNIANQLNNSHDNKSKIKVLS